MTDIVSPAGAASQFLVSISKPARILVAISGGSDSTGLLVALHRQLQSTGLSDVSLFAATVDHGLRAASANEAQEVARLCGRLGIVHFIRRWNDSKPQTGLSAASREARYRLLAEIADEISATAIVMAHTIDDQAETVAMRAARSERQENAGLAGMADAVLFDRRHWILRPFLNCRRADIRAFLSGEGIGWIDDPSNIDRKYERVRTRLRIAEEESGEVSAPGQAERRLRLSNAAGELLTRHGRMWGVGLAQLRPKALSAELPVLRHALGGLAAVLGGRTHAPASESMDRVLSLIAGGVPGRITAGRVIFDLRRDGLFTVRERRDILPLVLAPGATGLWDGRYRIANGLEREIRVESAGHLPASAAAERFPQVPSGVAARAMVVLPRILWNETGDIVAENHETGISIEARLAPYDRFLPRFELTLANAIARHIGRQSYSLPPL